jgi:hypothetical protein
MSFLGRTTIRSARTATFAPRAFSTSFVARKSPTEAVKDTVKTVDRKVSDKLVDGIELGRMFPLSQSANSLLPPPHYYSVSELFLPSKH